MRTPRLLNPVSASLVGLATAVIGLVTPSATVLADDAVKPAKGILKITGAGWGHGRGMSQYGAYGAATKGLEYTEILDFYYPGTKATKLDAKDVMRVWLTADTDSKLHFKRAAGLVITDSAGKKVKLPNTAKYTKWRINGSGDKRVLYYRNTAGKYVVYKIKLKSSAKWYVSNEKSGVVKVSMPNGTSVSYRGKVTLASTPNGLRTVNQVKTEDYLRSVVPAEMPASWPAEALKAQSVAARSYAARYRDNRPPDAGYDICDTTACQVYKGVGGEHKDTDAAIKATKNVILSHGGKPAWTEFSSSNGGWSVAGGPGYPYLVAKKDPYDGVKRDQSWDKTLTSAQLEAAYPKIGALKSVQITKRDGNGSYGGRVDQVKIVGKKDAITVTGAAFKSKFGLKERLFTIKGEAPAPDPEPEPEPEPTPPKPDPNALTGPIADAYAKVGGTDSMLGKPRTGVITTATGSYADFDLGRITCPTKGSCLVSYG